MSEVSDKVREEVRDLMIQTQDMEPEVWDFQPQEQAKFMAELLAVFWNADESRSPGGMADELAERLKRVLDEWYGR
jgi:hypothetical protein